jgi:hypothetical protein
VALADGTDALESVDAISRRCAFGFALDGERNCQSPTEQAQTTLNALGQEEIDQHIEYLGYKRQALQPQRPRRLPSSSEHDPEPSARSRVTGAVLISAADRTYTRQPDHGEEKNATCSPLSARRRAIVRVCHRENARDPSEAAPPLEGSAE